MEFAPEANRRSRKANIKRMAVASEGKWKEAFEAVKAQFELTDLLPEQEAIKIFFKGKNVCKFAHGLWKAAYFLKFAHCCGHCFW